jgi:phenylpropionate dioxygenase-like ring-hydroxylating dioxygenase large terminal subunit
MWIPVLQAKDLENKPVRVNYWGVPVVLFKGGNGVTAALEDICGHRKVPLSAGTVEGDNIRCPYHHFAFNAAGECENIPSTFKMDAENRRTCTVKKFYVRKAFKLIWISIEPEETNPFPFDGRSFPADEEFTTESVEIKGDFRVWAEHWLDLGHLIHAHSRSLIGSSKSDQYASIEDIKININAEDRFPVWNAETISISSPFRVSLPKALLQAKGLRNYLRKAIKGGYSGEHKVNGEAHLVTLCTQNAKISFQSGFGTYTYENFFSIIPIDSNTCRCFFSFYIHNNDQYNFIVRMLAKKYIKSYLKKMHLETEDAPWISKAVYSETFSATDLDDSVIAIRKLFKKYLAEKSGLYPAGSLVHKWK